MSSTDTNTLPEGWGAQYSRSPQGQREGGDVGGGGGGGGDGGDGGSDPRRAALLKELAEARERLAQLEAEDEAWRRRRAGGGRGWGGARGEL